MVAQRAVTPVPGERVARPSATPTRSQRANRPGFAAFLALAARQSDPTPIPSGRQLDPTTLALAARQRAAVPLAARPAPSPALRLPGNLGPIVAEAANRYGVDPALVAAVIEVESGFAPSAVSAAGAKGLMQLMDGTARALGVTDSLDPLQNVLGGTKFLGQLLDRYRGDVRLALAAYNAGPGAVDRYGGVPPFGETQRYVPKVLAAYERYRS